MEIINVKVINNNIHVLNDYLIKGRPKTYLNAAITANAGATMTVFNINGFSVGNYYALINPFCGNAELIKMHASTSPSGNTITLASNITKDHDANEPVYFVAFNQWVFSRATTATGVKTELAKENIDPSKLWSIYDDSNTTGFAFVQPYNSDGTSYPFVSSNYSAPAPYANASFNTAEYMIRQAMIESKQTTSEGEPQFTKELTTQYCLNQINECLRDIRKNKNKLSWTQSFKTVLGQTARGVFAYLLSGLTSEVYDIYSRKAIEAVRLGSKDDLIYVDPDYFFNTLLNDVKFTQVRTAVTGGAGTTTLEIDDSYNFDDSGSVQVGSVTITYTGVTRSATAGILTGIPASGTGSMTASISVDDYVFQGHVEGEPAYWTLFNGIIYIWGLPDSNNDNFNVEIDYFKAITEVDSLEDAIDYIQFDIIKNWLKWKIKSIAKNDGVENIQDPAYIQYRDGLRLLIRKDRNLNKKEFRNIYEFSDIGLRGNPRKYREGN